TCSLSRRCRRRRFPRFPYTTLVRSQERVVDEVARHLFTKLADSGLQRGLVQIAGTTGDAPRATHVCPPGSVLQQDMTGTGRIGRVHQQSGRPVEPPPMGPVGKLHPAVSVTVLHSNLLHVCDRPEPPCL